MMSMILGGIVPKVPDAQITQLQKMVNIYFNIVGRAKVIIVTMPIIPVIAARMVLITTDIASPSEPLEEFGCVKQISKSPLFHHYSTDKPGIATTTRFSAAKLQILVGKLKNSPSENTPKENPKKPYKMKHHLK